VTGLGASSADIADHFLREAGVACLDGAGFGAAGEGYIRFSYANSIEAIREALDAVEASLPGLAR
jgi:aspartate aminotransferase